MNDRWIYEDIYRLDTPVGFFSVESQSKAIPFSVEKATFYYPWEVTDNKNRIAGKIETETDYLISIKTSDLEIGIYYTICFSNGKWKYCDSDENTVCYNTIIDNWVIGIGAFDVNEEEKEEQALAYSKETGLLVHGKGIIQEPPFYDESKFKLYTVEPLEDKNGFVFKLLDRKRQYLYFSVAWVKVDIYPSTHYAAAVGFWLT